MTRGVKNDVEQTGKMVPLITSESALGQNVSKLVQGVDIFDLGLGVDIDLLKRTIKRNFKNIEESVMAEKMLSE